MNKEYMGINGNNYYLVDMRSNQGYVFSDFGGSVDAVKADYVLAICGVLTPVNIVSILSDANSPFSEIYFKGKKARVKGKGIEVFRKIPNTFPKATYITFRIVRKDCVGVSQILIPFKEGSVTRNMFNDIFGTLVWQ